MLLGRDHERQQIEQALAQARSGTSATLALVGEPGIGKTVLLGYAAEHAAGMQLLRARGIESEAQIPFGSLLELIRPALLMLEQDPASRRQPRWKARWRCGPGRLRTGSRLAPRRSACSPPTPSRPRSRCWSTTPSGWTASSAQALLFAFRRLVADPIAVFVAVREGEPSLLDGADLPVLQIGGLTSDEAAVLVPGLAPEAARRLHGVTAGNPLALLELASDADDLALAPEGAPVLVSARISRAFLHRAGLLDPAARQALVLSATSDTGDLPTLERAAARLGIDLSALAAAESAGLVALQAGVVEFRHPLARSAIYADAPASQRRDAHRALAAALPDRDVDRRAWHLAAAAAWHGRDSVSGARAGRRPRPGPQRVRDRGRGVRAGRAAHRRRRAAGAAVAGVGRGGVAGRLHRPRRRPARRGPRDGQRPRDDGRDRRAHRPHRDALRSGNARPRDPDGGRRAGGSRAGRRDARRGRLRLPLRWQPGADARRSPSGRKRCSPPTLRRAPASWPR